MEEARIMLVDDDGISLRGLSEMLRYHVPMASLQMYTSPHAALSALREHDVNLVLSDLQMPGMNGISLLKTARESGSHASFILMTGDATDEVLTDGLRIGIFAILRKPFDRAGLVPVIHQAIECDRLRREVAELRRMLTECGVELGTLIHSLAAESGENLQWQLPY